MSRIQLQPSFGEGHLTLPVPPAGAGILVWDAVGNWVEIGPAPYPITVSCDQWRADKTVNPGEKARFVVGLKTRKSGEEYAKWCRVKDHADVPLLVEGKS